jgi:hypothetical protein
MPNNAAKTLQKRLRVSFARLAENQCHPSRFRACIARLAET